MLRAALPDIQISGERMILISLTSRNLLLLPKNIIHEATARQVGLYHLVPTIGLTTKQEK